MSVIRRTILLARSLYPWSMALVPFYCLVCEHYCLQDELDIDAHGSAICQCGGVGRAISRDSYEAGDASLFAAVADSLSIARLSALGASRLLVELEPRESVASAAMLARMSELVPSLCIIELIATARAETTLKAVRMLVTILRAMAAQRSASDIVSLLSAPSERQRRQR